MAGGGREVGGGRNGGPHSSVGGRRTPQSEIRRSIRSFPSSRRPPSDRASAPDRVSASAARAASSSSSSASASAAAPSHPRDAGDVGLFTVPNLLRPPDFLSLASSATLRCDSLRSSVRSRLESGSSAATVSDAIDTLHILDEISNAVCSVIDAAELCRNAHADPEWRDYADRAFEMLSSYIAELNGDDALYRSLLAVCSDPGVFGALGEEERRMATMLRREFERDGIHLPPEERGEIQEITGHVVRLESLFNANISSCRRLFDADKEAVEAVMPRHVLESAVAPQDNPLRATVSTDPHVANSLLKYSSSPSLRREVFMETNTTCPENLEVLDALVAQRHLLATRQGFSSYAERMLKDRMAGDQRTVYDFLERMRGGCAGQYKEDMELISLAKRQLEDDGTVEAWDVPFYSGVLKANVCGDGADHNVLGGYFNVDNCIEGMRVLVDRLFGIDMEELPLSRGERWDIPSDDADGPDENSNGIRKFSFSHPTEGPLGTLYLDLHPRPGKYGHAAHFTVRCGCASRSEDGTIGGGGVASDEMEYQLPIVALVCNLSPPHSSTIGPDGGRVSLLSHAEVETLLHEFGHALHSLLSRTSFQHLSGTRAAMDFIETPSHVFEGYAWEPSFLDVIGRHYVTGDPIPKEVVTDLLRSRNAFRSVEVQNQLVYSAFDQALFGERQSPSPVSTTDLFRRLHGDHGVPHADGTHWHSRFGHLVTYGAGYYGYLYSSVFASDIWTTTLGGDGGDPMGRRGGMKIWKEMLAHGGARDPGAILKNLLGRDSEVGGFFGQMRWR